MGPNQYHSQKHVGYSKTTKLVAPLDRGKRLPDSVPQKAVIFEKARAVFQALALLSGTCIMLLSLANSALKCRASYYRCPSQPLPARREPTLLGRQPSTS